MKDCKEGSSSNILCSGLAKCVRARNNWPFNNTTLSYNNITLSLSLINNFFLHAVDKESREKSARIEWWIELAW